MCVAGRELWLLHFYLTFFLDETCLTNPAKHTEVTMSNTLYSTASASSSSDEAPASTASRKMQFVRSVAKSLVTIFSTGYSYCGPHAHPQGHKASSSSAHRDSVPLRDRSDSEGVV